MESRKEFSERFADLIEQRGWRGLFERDDFSSHTPYNPVGHITQYDKGDLDKSNTILCLEGEYSASNRLKLLAEGRGDDRWMTRAQAESIGGTIDPKVEGVDLEQWQYRDDDGTPLSCPKVSRFTVFNAEDVIGLKTEKAQEGPDHVAAYKDLIETLGFVMTKDSHNTYVQKEGEGIRYELGGASYPMGEAIVEKLGIRDNADLCACLIGGLLESAVSTYDKHTSYEPMVNKLGQGELLRKDHNALYRAARDADKAISWAFNPELRQEIEREFELKKSGKLHALDNRGYESHGVDIPIDPSVVEIKDRHYINVPFEDRDELQSVSKNVEYCVHAGAYWVPKDSDLSKVAKWEFAEPPSEDLSKSPVIEQFVAACEEQGLIMDKNDIIVDGGYYKVDIEGSNAVKTGAYRFSAKPDVPRGFIVNSETGVKKDWVYTGPSVNRNDIAALEVASVKRREENVKKFHDFTQQVAMESREHYNKDIDGGSKPFRYSHLKVATAENCPYVAEEQLNLPQATQKPIVNDYGFPNVPHCGSDGELYLDVRNSYGKIESLLRIDTEKQTFQRDYRPEGSYHLVYGPDISEDDNPMPSIIVKDYAQAVRIHNASGATVAVAFDDDNLLPVFSALKEREPYAPVIIAVDKAGVLNEEIEAEIFYRSDMVPSEVVVENLPDLNAMCKNNEHDKVGGYVQTTLEGTVNAQMKRMEEVKAAYKEATKSLSQETGLGA